MNARALRLLSLVDVIGIPIFVLLFIWKLQFIAHVSWIVFPIWLGASFLLHRDTPKTLGWRADNLWAATKWAFVAFVIMAALLIATGFALGQPRKLPPNFSAPSRLWAYFAFCLLQQVALNSLLTNRLLSLLHRDWIAALFASLIFAACHWPNPVLVPLTFIGGIVLAWLFARRRNILPLALIQAVLGSIAWWSFPIAWHHNLRVGPGYYLPWK
ncbi:MAG TPA: CPBP family intramembrane glutamic endopeptidase [Candidatus Acidoferrales bacterium]|nr:CPBP family intramembrane glutamic endopeptidase [Candidatus Acidoferrales bacterium]